MKRGNPGSINWMALTVAISIGLLGGIGLFTFDYAEGLSYLSDDPQACINCHVMREQYSGWTRSSHQAVAACNDCHTPHTFFAKWFIKGLNGWNHSVAFTTGNFPNTIRIKPLNAGVVEANCVECHQVMVSNLHRESDEEALSCVACHGNVGHRR